MFSANYQSLQVRRGRLLDLVTLHRQMETFLNTQNEHLTGDIKGIEDIYVRNVFHNLVQSAQKGPKLGLVQQKTGFREEGNRNSPRKPGFGPKSARRGGLKARNAPNRAANPKNPKKTAPTKERTGRNQRSL